MATRVAAGQTLCPKCLAESAEAPGAKYVSPVETIRVKAQGEQRFQAVVYAVTHAIGAVVMAEYTLIRFYRYWDGPRSTYLTVGVVAAVVGGVVGYFVGLGRPPWRDDLDR